MLSAPQPFCTLRPSLEVLVGPVGEGRSLLGGRGRFAEHCSELGSLGKLISPEKWERRRESICGAQLQLR